MEFEKFSDAEVLSRIVKGEKELYEIIVRRYNPALYKVGRSYNYNHEDTEDLMQETFIDAYKSLNKFEGRATFKTWIIRIMMNNCYRKKEKSSFKNEINKELKDNATPMYSDARSGADKILQNRELGANIENALSKIPDDYRIIFSLREINGINVAETASLLTISESNVKARLSRAKAMLRNQIEHSYSAAELFELNLIYCDAIVKNVMKAINEI